MKQRRKLNPVFVGIVVFLLVLALVGPFITKLVHPTKYIQCDATTLTIDVLYYQGNEAATRQISLPRGASVTIKEANESSSIVRYQDETFTIDNTYLANSLSECVDFEYVYPRRLINMRDKKDGQIVKTIAKKAERLRVVSVNENDLDTTTGEIRWFQVEKDNKTYWINGTAVETTPDLAKVDYATSLAYSSYWDEYYGQGYSKNAFIDQIDYKPIEKVQYEDNIMPKQVNAVHVSLENMLLDKEYFLSLNDTTGINSIVVELKGDGGSLFYDSKVIDDYLKDPELASQNALADTEQLKALIQEYQDDGYYVIGRLVTFKDAIFASQNPHESITDKDGNLILHNDEYWPSAYSRDTWQYNVAIAKEIASLGINEIQFDYVRFPDGMVNTKDTLDLHNTYNESKTAAIQNFLLYARQELTPYHVYLAADIFAWPVVAQDDQDIGQYLPAIANVVDVVCPMPYADHFSQGAMGIENPVTQPKETLYQFTSIAKKQLQSLVYPAKYRTWIQGYSYGSDDIKNEIEGIYQANAFGYMVWYGNGNKSDIKSIQDGFISKSK